MRRGIFLRTSSARLEQRQPRRIVVPRLCVGIQIWTLQLLGLTPFEPERCFNWEEVSEYCSKQNTLKLFQRFFCDFCDTELQGKIPKAPGGYCAAELLSRMAFFNHGPVAHGI